MKRLNINILAAFIVIMLLVVLCGCTSGAKPSADATSAANTAAERILQSFNTGNYTDFSTNFSAGANAGINQSVFSDVKNSLTSQYGSYQSMSGPQFLANTSGDNDFAYKTKFEKGNLTFVLAMNVTNIYQVDGVHYG